MSMTRPVHSSAGRSGTRPQFVRGVLKEGFGDAYACESLGQSEDRRLPVDGRGVLVVLSL